MITKLNPTKQTNLRQKNEVERDWYLFNAEGQILGRLASTIVRYLMGKHKKDYLPHLDMGDQVVVINARQIKITGRKINQKDYSYYSGYPGGLRVVSLKQMLEKKPEDVIRHAVLGMLPKNKLRRQRIKRLFVFPDEDHPFKEKPLKIVK